MNRATINMDIELALMKYMPKPEDNWRIRIDDELVIGSCIHEDMIILVVRRHVDTIAITGMYLETYTITNLPTIAGVLSSEIVKAYDKKEE